MLLTIISFIIVLSILVFVHEMGHYLAARHVGVRVEQFSIGFPPKVIGRKWGETEYLLSWLPLGGYVRLFGQNMDDEDPTNPRNYASKTVWQRLYILVAGPLANLLLALIIMPVVYLIGVETAGYRADPVVINNVVADSPAGKAGFLTGDQVVALEETPISSWNSLSAALEARAIQPGAVTLTVLREGTQVALAIPMSAFTSTKPVGWQPLIQPLVGRVSPGSAAEEAGLKSGDRILAVDGTAISHWGDISGQIQKHEGRAVAFEIERAGSSFTVTFAPQYHEESQSWLIGISPITQRERYGPFAAIAKGTQRVFEITVMTFAFLGNLLSGQGSMDQVGGPVKIGSFIGEAARTSASSLALLMAVISLQLFIFNMLPIPALDGGQIFFFLLPEALRGGRPLRPLVRVRIQTVGFSVLILLMVFVTYNDILQLLS